MFGFLFGVLCLFGLYHFLTHDGMFRNGFGSRHRGRLHRHFFLRRLFSRLDTSPGQERAIEGAVSDLEDEWRKIRQDKEALHEEVATIMREETLDSVRLQAALSSREGALAGLRSAAVKALSQVHEALDPYQRRRLSEMLVSGFGHGCRRGRFS